MSSERATSSTRSTKFVPRWRDTLSFRKVTKKEKSLKSKARKMAWPANANENTGREGACETIWGQDRGGCRLLGSETPSREADEVWQKSMESESKRGLWE
jgi:hypothetical protein